MSRSRVGPAVAAVLAVALLAPPARAGAAADFPPDRRPLYRLDYAPFVKGEGEVPERWEGLALGVELHRWTRFAIAAELAVDAGVGLGTVGPPGAYESYLTQTDVTLILAGSLDLNDRSQAACTPVLTLGAGAARTRIESDDHGWSDTLVAPVLLAGAGLDFNGPRWGSFHLGAEWLWWRGDLFPGDPPGYSGGLGGLRLKVGVAVPFSWPWGR